MTTTSKVSDFGHFISRVSSPIVGGGGSSICPSVASHSLIITPLAKTLMLQKLHRFAFHSRENTNPHISEEILTQFQIFLQTFKIIRPVRFKKLIIECFPPIRLTLVSFWRCLPIFNASQKCFSYFEHFLVAYSKFPISKHYFL